MGHWAIHIEGGGIHDNGRPDDVDAMLKNFVEDLATHHSVESATLTVGQTRELVHPASLNETADAHDDAARPYERAYQYRTH
jgi:hypothetical protein